MENNMKFVEALTVFIAKYFENTNTDIKLPETDKYKDNIPIAKSVDEELKQATFVVLVPDEVDLHGDIYDEDTVRKACHNFNLHCQKANLFHVVDTDLSSIVESYTTITDMYIDDRLIKKGTWLQVHQINDDGLWAMVKSGEINGASVQCLGNVENLDD